MFGIDELKEQLGVNEHTVECPVRNCTTIVPLQRRVFRREEQFKCPYHNIYISPSTFEYFSERENLLFSDPEEIELLWQIMQFKRESRIVRDNSEDAVSWNVFRYLERNGLIESWLKWICGMTVTDAEVIYWSYCRSEKGNWSELNRARDEFGENIARGSEPDIIIRTNRALFFIEAKFGATNDTIPSNPKDSKQYETGGSRWFEKVFSSDYYTIAVLERKYELLRFWLLGSWMAEKQNLSFFLLNLVPADREIHIDSVFKKHIVEHEYRQFARCSWEGVHQIVINHASDGPDRELILRYFRNKTFGYNSNRVIQKAFSC